MTRWMVVFCSIFLPLSSWGYSIGNCEATEVSAHLMYVNRISKSEALGEVIEQRVMGLNDVLSKSAFKDAYIVSHSVSILDDYESSSQQDVVSTFQVRFAASYEAVTMLHQSKDFLSLELSSSCKGNS